LALRETKFAALSAVLARGGVPKVFDLPLWTYEYKTSSDVM